MSNIVLIDAGVASWSPLVAYVPGDVVQAPSGGIYTATDPTTNDPPPSIHWTPGRAPALPVWKSRLDVGSLGSGLHAATASAGAGVFIVTDGYSVSFRSADKGLTWTKIAPIASVGDAKWSSDPLFAVIQGNAATDGNGIWVSGGSASFVSGRPLNDTMPMLVRSTDNGITWTAIVPPLALTSASLVTASYLNGTFLVVGTGSNGAMTDGYQVSTDGGVTWVAPMTYSCNTFSFDGLMNDGTQFIALVASLPSYQNKLAKSPDGVTWTEFAAPPMIWWNCPIAYGNGIYLSANADGTLSRATTPEGLATAATISPGLAAAPICAIAFGQSGFGVNTGVFVCMGIAGDSAHSIDNGLTWIPDTLDLGPTSAGMAAQSVAYESGTFVASTYNGLISSIP